MPRLALLPVSEVVLLLPVEVGLFAHFGSALAGGDAHGADVDAIGFGALQQGDVSQAWCRRDQRFQQVAQHAVVDADLSLVAPAVD